MLITSLENRQVKYVRSLQRRRVRYRERVFLVEGLRLLEEALRAGVMPALLFHTASFNETPRGRLLLAEYKGPTYEVSEEVMRYLSNLVSPPGVLAVVPFVELEAPPEPGLILVLDSVREPGNLGAILRSAEAAGTSLVILAPQTVDVYNPKVVRGAMGAHFRLPIARLAWPQIELALKGRAVFLADARGELVYYEVDWTSPSALILGGEAEGANPQAEKLSSGRVAIPMQGKVESLNVAVAASIILFEVARQRASLNRT